MGGAMTRAIIFYTASTLTVFFYALSVPFVWLTDFFLEIAQHHEDQA
jgi:hypothetical protein